MNKTKTNMEKKERIKEAAQKLINWSTLHSMYWYGNLVKGSLSILDSDEIKTQYDSLEKLREGVSQLLLRDHYLQARQTIDLMESIRIFLSETHGVMRRRVGRLASLKKEYKQDKYAKYKK